MHVCRSAVNVISLLVFLYRDMYVVLLVMVEVVNKQPDKNDGDLQKKCNRQERTTFFFFDACTVQVGNTCVKHGNLRRT